MPPLSRLHQPGRVDVALPDHPTKPPASQLGALALFASRMDARTGCGYVALDQVSADTGAGHNTVDRALAWARMYGFVHQAARGHRLGNGRPVASGWQLSTPQREGKRNPLNIPGRGW